MEYNALGGLTRQNPLAPQVPIPVIAEIVEVNLTSLQKESSRQKAILQHKLRFAALREMLYPWESILQSIKKDKFPGSVLMCVDHYDQIGPNPKDFYSAFLIPYCGNNPIDQNGSRTLLGLYAIQMDRSFSLAVVFHKNFNFERLMKIFEISLNSIREGYHESDSPEDHFLFTPSHLGYTALFGDYTDALPEISELSDNILWSQDIVSSDNEIEVVNMNGAQYDQALEYILNNIKAIL